MPKIKTNSGAAKRFRVTGTGKLKSSKAGRRHLLLSNSAKTSRSTRRPTYVAKGDGKRIKKLLPYS